MFKNFADVLALTSVLVIASLWLTPLQAHSYEDAPLPDFFDYVKPDRDVPSDRAGWSGQWVGAWGGSRTIVFIVEKVSASAAQAIYAYGESSRGKPGSWIRIVAPIEDGKLSFTLINRFKFTLNSPTSMDAEWDAGGGFSTASLKKVPMVLPPSNHMFEDLSQQAKIVLGDLGTKNFPKLCKLKKADRRKALKRAYYRSHNLLDRNSFRTARKEVWAKLCR